MWFSQNTKPLAQGLSQASMGACAGWALTQHVDARLWAGLSREVDGAAEAAGKLVPLEKPPVGGSAGFVLRFPSCLSKPRLTGALAGKSLLVFQ